MPEPELDLSAIIGPPIDDIMRLLLEPYADDRVAEAVAAYRADYGQNGLFDSLPYSGIAQALAETRQSGARLYLATSKRTSFALRILEHLDLAAFFDGIYGSEAGGAAVKFYKSRTAPVAEALAPVVSITSANARPEPARGA